MYSFGAGLLWGTPKLDSVGATIANPTPLLFGTLQDVSLDISRELKMLHGQNQFPVAVGAGKGKISGKAKVANIFAQFWNTVFFGQTLSSGLVGINYETAGTLIPTTPFQVTIAPPNSGTFTDDLGVIDANGKPMARVPSGATTGQYSVNTTTGVYTFATADVGLRVYINYKYTATVTGAQKQTVVNQPMGYAPVFKVDLLMAYQGKQLTVSLPNAIGGKMGLATKLDDFMVPEFEFEAFADGAGNVLTMSMSE